MMGRRSLRWYFAMWKESMTPRCMLWRMEWRKSWRLLIHFLFVVKIWRHFSICWVPHAKVRKDFTEIVKKLWWKWKKITTKDFLRYFFHFHHNFFTFTHFLVSYEFLMVLRSWKCVVNAGLFRDWSSPQNTCRLLSRYQISQSYRLQHLQWLHYLHRRPISQVLDHFSAGKKSTVYKFGTDL